MRIKARALSESPDLHGSTTEPSNFATGPLELIDKCDVLGPWTLGAHLGNEGSSNLKFHPSNFT